MMRHRQKSGSATAGRQGEGLRDEGGGDKVYQDKEERTTRRGANHIVVPSRTSYTRTPTVSCPTVYTGTVVLVLVLYTVVLCNMYPLPVPGTGTFVCCFPFTRIEATASTNM